MSSYLETLRRSLVDRATSLESYVSSLQARTARTDDEFELALEMCLLYARLFARHVDLDWEMESDPGLRHTLLKRLMKDFQEKETWIDQRFARATAGDVPRPLKTIVRHEFHMLGLDIHDPVRKIPAYDPVLTVGPPDNFDTYLKGIREYLFEAVNADNFDFVDLPRDRRHSLISVPLVEGARTLWYPITIGHEVGHVRVARERLTYDFPNTYAWTTLSDFEQELIPSLREAASDYELALKIREAQKILGYWVEETLCDLNAIRLFGHAGLCAVAEFLAVLARPDGVSPETPSDRHPPLSLRLEMMKGFLDYLGEPDLTGHADAWSDYQWHDALSLDSKWQFAAYVLRKEENMATLFRHVLAWGTVYRSSERARHVDWLSSEFLGGIPGGTHCPNVASYDHAWITTADIVNAAWAARGMLDTPSRPDDVKQPALLREISDHQQRRVILDRLASKAVDSLEFASLWAATGGEVVHNRSGKTIKRRLRRSPTPGVLSRGQILERLHEDGQRRLAVTPLLEPAIQDAGIDLRLCPDFIVQRHSATTAFNPLDRDQDPRAMQEHVQKSWNVPFILHPGETVLGATLEYVFVPTDLSAQVVTRSSYGRVGLVTATAVEVQPGSPGVITLELVNLSETPITLSPGLRIAQLVLFGIGDSEKATTGTYRFAVGPEFSKIEGDRDAAPLRRLQAVTHSRLGGDLLFGSARLLRRMAFVFAGEHDQVGLFSRIAAAEGAGTAITLAENDTRPSPVAAALLATEDRAAECCARGDTSLPALAIAIERLSRLLSRGAVIEVSDVEDEAIGTRALIRLSAPDSSPTFTILSTRHRWTVEVSESEGSAEIEDFFANALASRGTAPPRRAIMWPDEGATNTDS